MGTTILQQLLMHYNTRSFKPDKRPPFLKLVADKFFQFRAHGRRNLHLVAAEPARDVDGLPIGMQKLYARWAIAKMFVEPAFCFRVDSPLDIFEQQPFDIAASRSKQLL